MTQATGAEEGRGIAAKSSGEGPSTRYDPEVPEWGNPPRRLGTQTYCEASGGTETSKYPEERKAFPE